MGTNIKFLRGASAGLADLVTTNSVQDGHFYLTTDTRRLYAGIARTDGTAVDLALLNHDITFVDSMQSLSGLSPKSIDGSQLFYAKAENVLSIFDSSLGQFVKINQDRGAIGVSVDAENADGNAITSIRYDEATRKLILEKGETFVTALELEEARTDVYTIIVSKEDATTKTIETLVSEYNANEENTAIVPTPGDVLLVKYLVSTDDYLTTAYVFDNATKKWVACSGNVSAENVYFTSDLLTTSAVGNITLTNGQATISASGKNLKEVFNTIFVKEVTTGLKTKDPSISISTEIEYVEVGSTVSPDYSASFSAGTYKYGPATGVTVSEWAVTNSKTNEKLTSNSGTFANYTFPASPTTYDVTVVATHGAGVSPVSNTGNPVSSQAITSGSKSKTATLFQSYVPNFYGYTTTSNKLSSITAESLTTAFVRGLTNQGSDTTPKSSVEINEKWMQFFYAVPSGRSVLASAKDGNNITFTVNKISGVTIANVGSATTSYDIYYISNAAEYGETTVQMTWS